MRQKRRVWAAVTIVAIPIGGTIGRLHLIGPNPGTFFALGVIATLSIFGIAFGVWDSRRVVRSGLPIRN